MAQRTTGAFNDVSFSESASSNFNVAARSRSVSVSGPAPPGDIKVLKMQIGSKHRSICPGISFHYLRGQLQLVRAAGRYCFKEPNGWNNDIDE